jgi:hypothetical protein
MRPPGRRLRTMAPTVSTLQYVGILFIYLFITFLFYYSYYGGRREGGRGGGEDQFGMCSRTSIARIVPRTNSEKSVP